MSTPEQVFQTTALTGDELLIWERLQLQEELANCSQRYSDIGKEMQNLIQRVMASEVVLAERHINKDFLYQRPIPSSLGGPEIPVLRIVEN